MVQILRHGPLTARLHSSLRDLRQQQLRLAVAERALQRNSQHPLCCERLEMTCAAVVKRACAQQASKIQYKGGQDDGT
jgi:hypothetical protein